ncbi:MAG: hypothetical protein KDC27_02055 [Acidobacteria bacterium]|nr:hypothetical protein [Acidobacteriota bacterium]
MIALARRVLRRVGPVAARLLPANVVWPVAVCVSRWAARVLEACGVRHPWGLRLEEFLLAEALTALSRGGARFPVMVEVEREAELAALCRREPKLLALSVHVPLNRLFLRRLREWGRTVQVVVRKFDGPVWGLGERLDRIVYSPHVFLDIRRALEGSSVVFLAMDGLCSREADGGYTAEVSPSVLRFAHRSRTPLLVYRTLLDSSGRGRVVWAEGGDPKAPYEELVRQCRHAFERVYAQPHDPRVRWLRASEGRREG